MTLLERITGIVEAFGDSTSIRFAYMALSNLAYNYTFVSRGCFTVFVSHENVGYYITMDKQKLCMADNGMFGIRHIKTIGKWYVLSVPVLEPVNTSDYNIICDVIENAHEGRDCFNVEEITNSCINDVTSYCANESDDKRIRLFFVKMLILIKHMSKEYGNEKLLIDHGDENIMVDCNNNIVPIDILFLEYD